jgi:hypothetical protein
MSAVAAQRNRHSVPRPHGAPRFTIRVVEHDPSEEPGWTHQLMLLDRDYEDPWNRGVAADGIAGGDSWEEAYATAFDMIELALDSDTCIFGEGDFVPQHEHIPGSVNDRNEFVCECGEVLGR